MEDLSFFRFLAFFLWSDCVLFFLDEIARPGLFSERIGLLTGKTHDQVVLHQVVHGKTLATEEEEELEEGGKQHSDWLSNKQSDSVKS